MNALIIFAKFPVPGKVKKEIGRVLGMDVSARLCTVFINDLIAEHKDRDYDLYLSFIGHEYKDDYKKMFPEAILYVQRGTNMSENMYSAFEDLLDDYDKVVLIGCDVPQLKHDMIIKAFNALDSYDFVLGPSDDGGYYLIGMKEPHEVFKGMPWGSSELLEVQQNLLRDKRLTFVRLDTMPDVDDVDELVRLKSVLKKEDAPQTYEFIQKLDI
ncbi:TIGR04282 family arsenosugar biosynthesis glycosyltransferase [Candidatus Woesearchaeota archaeon]|nr:TIGR04282 family arsenosugar biosynthesis glycosyltransferase [Candidatus Woesearchaeota archaeon]